MRKIYTRKYIGFYSLWCTHFGATFGCSVGEPSSAVGSRMLLLEFCLWMGFSIKDPRKSRGFASLWKCWVKQQRFPSILTLQPPHKSCPRPGTGLWKVAIFEVFPSLFHSQSPSSPGGELQPGSPMFSVPCGELQTAAGSAPHGPSPSAMGQEQLRVPLAPLSIRLPSALPSLSPAPPPPSLPPSPLVFFFMDGMRWRSKNY